MAKIVIGKVRPVDKGPYDNDATYTLLDRVSVNGILYECQVDSVTGKNPPDSTEWAQVSSPITVAEVATINNKLAAAESNIQSLQSTTTTATGNISTLQSKVSTIESNVTSLATNKVTADDVTEMLNEFKEKNAPSVTITSESDFPKLRNVPDGGFVIVNPGESATDEECDALVTKMNEWITLNKPWG